MTYETLAAINRIDEASCRKIERKRADKFCNDKEKHGYIEAILSVRSMISAAKREDFYNGYYHF